MKPEAAAVLDIKDTLGVPASLGNETVHDDWDKHFTALVAENADVIIESPRLPGVKIPFGAAMLMCQGRLTPENVNQYYAEGLQLLANRVDEDKEKAENEAEEDDKNKEEAAEQPGGDDDEKATKSEHPPKQSDLDKTYSRPQPKAEAGAAKPLSSDGAPNILAKNSPIGRHAKAGGQPASAGSRPQSKADAAKPSAKAEAKTKKSAPDFEKPATDVTVNSTNEMPPALHLSLPAEIGLESDFTERPLLSLETPAIWHETLQQLDEIPAIDFIDSEEIPLGQFEIDEPAVFDESQKTGESTFDLAGISPPEQLAELSANLDEIENSLNLISEIIANSEPQTAEKVNDILDMIIEVPAKLAADNGESIINETEARAELEELLFALFDELGIEYEDKLVESFARLILKYPLTAEIENLKTKDKFDQAPQDSGTHEVIKQLLAGLSSVKKAVIHAYAIGKSALKLYRLSFAA